MSLTVDIDGETSTHSLGRLAVWSDDWAPTFSSTQHFFNAVRRERKHQAMGERMRRWMTDRGNQVVRESFTEAMGEKGWET